MAEISTYGNISKFADEATVREYVSKMSKDLNFLLQNLDSANVTSIYTNRTTVQDSDGYTKINGALLQMYDNQSPAVKRVEMGYDGSDFIFSLLNEAGTETITLDASGDATITGTLSAGSLFIGTIDSTATIGSTSAGDVETSANNSLQEDTEYNKIKINSTDGLVATNASDTSRTTITAGEIKVEKGDGGGGWTDQFYVSSGDLYFAGALNGASGTFSGSLSAATGTFAGSLSAASGTFSGTVSAGTVSGSTITGGSININSGVFQVDSSGNLTASSATISGEVNASSGTFSGSISVTGTLSGGTVSGATITGGSININSGTFEVDSSGNLSASSVTITGASTVITVGSAGSNQAVMNANGFYIKSSGTTYGQTYYTSSNYIFNAQNGADVYVHATSGAATFRSSGSSNTTTIESVNSDVILTAGGDVYKGSSAAGNQILDRDEGDTRWLLKTAGFDGSFTNFEGDTVTIVDGQITDVS